MPANFFHAFAAGDMPELHRQMGCMASIFQMFDRQYLLAGERLAAPDQRRRPSSSGHSLSNSTAIRADRLSSSPHIVLKKNLSKSSNENQRVSLESSRTSFSSSSCSSFSSLERNGPAQQDPPSIDRILFPEIDAGHRPPDFRDTTEDSIYKGSSNAHQENHDCSPKGAVQPPMPMDGSRKIGHRGKPKAPMDPNEPYEVLVQIKESSRCSSEAIQLPRLSYDAKDPFFNPPDSKNNGGPSSKHREMLRLSLDSREGSLWSSGFYSRPTSNTKSVVDVQQDQASCKHPPGIVAKLMGLDALPDFGPASQETTQSVPRSKAIQDREQDLISATLKSSVLEPVAARQKRSSARVMRSVPKSRHPIETAPWKQQTSYRTQEIHIKQPHASIYREVEKRLKDLELQQSNRDLRALKQILGSRQAKGLLETGESEGSSMEIPDHDNLDSKQQDSNAARAVKSPIVFMMPPKSANLSCVSASSPILSSDGMSGLRRLRASNPSNKRRPPMSIKTAKDQTPKSNPRLPASPRTSERSSRSQQPARENNVSSVKNSSSTSLRLQQRKINTDRKSLPPIPSTEPNKTQRYSVRRNSPDSASPINSLKRKQSQAQQQDDQSSEKSAGTRSLSHHGDEISFRSDSNISLAAQMEMEVSSADKSDETNTSFFQQDRQSPCGGCAEKAASILQKKESSRYLEEDTSSLGPASISPEQPSPVSVLDTKFYQHGLPPLKTKTSSACRDQDRKTSELGYEFNHKKLESIENLVQKLRQLTSTNDEGRATDHIALLCDTPSPDHRYISEILLASGFLMKGLIPGQASSEMAFQLHASGYPINPDLFLVLEQRKSGRINKPEKARENTNQARPNPQKVCRKLLFDLVNELLIRKLDPGLLFQARTVIRRAHSGQQLLRELCSEIELLKSKKGSCEDDSNAISGEDLVRNSEGWTRFDREMSGIVLDIERSTFKDLIDEVMAGEASTVLQAKAGRLKRQHFPRK